MPPTCNVDGQIVPESEARVSVLDRGFLFGDSAYEVLRTHRGVPFAWPEHFDRLRRSADGIGLELDLDDEALLRRIKATVAAAAVDPAYIRIIVTRGVGSRPNIDVAFAPGPPTWVIMVRELPERAAAGVRLAVIPRLRNDPRALDPAIKSGNYLNNVLGLAEAKARGATDCLFLNAAGHVTEASTANFYAVLDQRVLTPPLSAGLLAGTTRRLLQQLCEDLGRDFVEREISRQDLAAATEMFLSSTLRSVVPVLEVDGRPVGGGQPGPVTDELQHAFATMCDQRTRDLYAPAWDASSGPDGHPARHPLRTA
ncbi:MAG: aminotransferase class IV [Planctomycetota bacterium]